MFYGLCWVDLPPTRIPNAKTNMKNGFWKVKRNTFGIGNIWFFRKWFWDEFILLGSAESVVAVVWVAILLVSTDFELIFGLEVSHSPTFILEYCFSKLGVRNVQIVLCGLLMLFELKLAMLIELGSVVEHVVSLRMQRMSYPYECKNMSHPCECWACRILANAYWIDWFWTIVFD